MSRPFVVFSLPRSRSAWLSVLLSSPGAVVGHDIGPTVSSPAQFIRCLREHYVGTCETGAAFAWRLIRAELPDAVFMVVQRDSDAVCRSLGQFGLVGYEAEMEQRTAQLAEISAQAGTLTLGFEDLASEDACAKAYGHCLGRDMPRPWWRHLDPINIQVDMHRQLQLLASRHTEIEGLKAQARELMADA